MTARQELREQVQGLWHQAVVGLEGIKDRVVRTASERLDVDTRKLQERRNELFARVGSRAVHFADSGVPLPSKVKGFIVRLGNLASKAAESSEPNKRGDHHGEPHFADAKASRASGESGRHEHAASAEGKSQGGTRGGGHRAAQDKSTGKGSGERSKRARRPKKPS